MGSFASCMSKATALHSDDKQAILAAVGELQGQAAQDAAVKAVDAQLAVVGGLISNATAPAAESTAPRKVYKSRKSAELARDAQGNTHKLQKVKDGFIIRQKTDKELAAEDRNGRRLAAGAVIDVENDSLLTAIAKLGGLKLTDRSDTIGEGNKNIGGKMLFRKDGRQLDDIANNALQEYGYIPASERADPTNWLQAAIQSEFTGRQQYYSDQGTEWMQDTQTAPTDQELAEWTSAELEEDGYTTAAPFVQAMTEQMIAEAQALGIDTESIKDDAARSTEGQSANDYHLAIQEAIRAAFGKVAADAARSNAGTTSTSNQDRIQTDGAQGNSSADEGLTLSTQSSDDLKAKAAREEAARKSDAAEQRTLAQRDAAEKRKRDKAEFDARADVERKARADAAVNDFELGQAPPSSKVNQDEAAGQGSVFDEPATPAAVEKAAPAAKIDDFGSKLEGARKDYATTLKDAQDVDIAAEPLSKSWPEPDYQKLLDGGTAPYVVAFIRAARDEVPTKPQKSWKLKGWVTSVQSLRDMATNMLDGKISEAKLRETLALPQFKNMSGLVSSRAELYELVGHGQSLKGISFAKNEYGLYQGQKNVTKWVVEQKAKATTFSNWPRELAVADTKAEMLDQFKTKIEGLDLGSKAKGQTQFTIYRKRGQEGAFIGKKIGREYIDLKQLPDVKEARKYMADNAAELEKALAQYKQTPLERNAENQPRVGDDHRNGAPVTPEIFTETFGFRGVQFGNYVEQGRRQSDLNQAFDSLMDLAAVLGVPPRALSLNGELGLAFGARGKGGKDAPAAHYEPGNVVINLTKNSGPGSLAHEWWHATDNYFGKNSGAGGYGTDNALGNKTRAELKAAFDEVKKATQQGTLRRRAMALDKRKSKPYWDTPIELSARSFETYVIAKLQDQNAANDYLANVVSKEFWDAQESLREGFTTDGKLEPTYPYPTPDEVPAVRAAFDNFFKVVETKTDDTGNVSMFSRTEASTGTATPESLRASLETEFGKETVAALERAGLLSIERAPRPGMPNDVAGASNADGIGLFANNTVANSTAVAYHEALHATLKQIIGQENYDALMARLAKIDKAATEGSAVQRFFSEAQARIPEDITGADRLEELAAYSVEQLQSDREKMPVLLRKWAQDIMASLRAGLAKLLTAAGIARGVRARLLADPATLHKLARDGLQAMARQGMGNDMAMAYSQQAAGPKWYSALKKAVASMSMGAAPAQGWKDSIKGLVAKGTVKADELEWTGLNEWLDLQPGKVTKQAVDDYLKANGVQVTETVLGGRLGDDLPKGWTVLQDVEDSSQWTVFDDENAVRGEGSSRDEAISDAQDESESGVGGVGTKYGNYQLPGGTNYREVLLTLPTQLTEDQKARRDKQSISYFGQPFNELNQQQQARIDSQLVGMPKFNSSHWDQPNILAHIRVNDRTDADGRRVLFVEEIQSDWGQAGKKRGFNEGGLPARDALATYEKALQRRYDDWLAGELSLDGQTSADKFTANMRLGDMARAIGEGDKYLNLFQNMERERGEVSKRVPSAPFVGKTDAWVSLALKRVIKMAVDGGYDKVAFVTGEQSAERYDLSKTLGNLRYEDAGVKRKSELDMGAPDGPGTLYAYDLNGTLVIDKATTPDALADLIGKDAAAKLLSAAPAERDGGSNGFTRRRELSGLDLKVGGEGMKAFYDKIVPAVAKDVLRKMGGGALFRPSEVAKPNNIVEHYSDLGQGGEPLVAALKPVVDSGVVSALENNQVRQAVIKALPVNVVNMLADKGVSAEQFVRDPKVLTAKLSVEMGLTVSNGLRDALDGLGARLRTGLDAAYKARLDGEVLPAVRASDIETDVAARVLFPQARQGGGAIADAGGGVGLRGARPTAEAGAVAPRPGGVEGGTAALTKFVDWHGSIVAHGGGESALDNALQFLITPAMRDKASGGMPMFSRSQQTNTEAFKTWFGDSKVVDAEGKPLVVYHGTDGDRSVFATDRANYFTADPSAASVYAVGFGKPRDGANVTPVYLSVKNPKWMPLTDSAKLTASDLAAIKADGFDGVFGWVLDTGMSNPKPIAREAGTGQRGMDRIVTELIPVSPEQIKSSTGNNGAFDGKNPDIRYSRALGGALNSALNSVRDVSLPAGYKVADLMDSAGKISVWHKTVGSQYNLAQRSPTFKRVFDGVQNFLNDASFYANAAGDLAPKILPKLDGIKDIAKQPLSAENTKAIAAPIFEGTLSWARDAKGKAVQVDELKTAAGLLDSQAKAQALFKAGHLSEQVLKMWQGLEVDQFNTIIDAKYERDMLKEGVVWTDAELKSQFNATPEQIALYREFRAATDMSLSNLAVSEMVNYAGKDADAVRAQVLATTDHQQAAVLLRDHLFGLAEADPARADALNASGNKMIDIADHASDMQKRGYAPLSRFGTFTLEATLPTGERYFSLFETARERSRMQRQLTQDGATAISAGTMSQEDFKLLNGISPETAALFGEMLGLDSQGSKAKDQAFAEYIKRGTSNRSAMKRLLKRQGIAGFSEDAGRVLAGFVYSNGRKTSSNLHMGEVTQAVSDMDKQGGELKDAAVRLTEYIKNPQEEAQALRGLLFAQYLGGSVASAMVNATQPFTVTFPYLSQYGGITKAAKQMTAAVKSASKATTGDATLDAALKKAADEGTLSPQETHQLMAQAQGKSALQSGDGTTMGNATAKASNAMAKVALAWGKVFGVAEQFNRRVTFIAAYRTAIEQGIADPAGFAVKAVNETQFISNKGNKPRWARGAIGSTLFTFKSYSVQYLELLQRMATAGEPGSPERASGRKAALLAVAVLFLLGGTDGLPFEADIEDVLDGFMQSLGYNFSTKRSKNEFLANLLGEGMAQFAAKGLSGLPGAPIDVSGRMGMGNLIPGTGLLTKKTDHTSDVAELFGPAADLAKRAFTAGGQLIDGKPIDAALTMSPVASRNIQKAAQMISTGQYRDAKNNKIVDVTLGEAILKGIGFQPNSVAKIQAASSIVFEMKDVYNLRHAELTGRMAVAILDSDQDEKQAVREAVKLWNEDNPTIKMQLNMPSIISKVKTMRQDKATRLAQTSPKGIRAEVRRQMSEAAQ